MKQQLIVQKYGGTSVANIERIQAVAEKVHRLHLQGKSMVVVLSAMSGETNRLLSLADEISKTSGNREKDMLVATGEQVTIALLTMALHKLGCSATCYTGPQIAIKTDNLHSKARINHIDVTKVLDDLEQNKVVVVAGFQGVNERGDITTLGRGGSDTSAVALAAALKADECQIYTDVTGVFTTDPRVVKNAKKLDKISFEEMLEMSSLGSKVLQIRSVEFASKYKVPLRVLSSFEDGDGTLIVDNTNKDTDMENPVIAGIAFNKDEAKLTILGMPDTPGSATSVLTTISEAGIEVDMIVQNIGSQDGTVDLSFTVHRNDYAQALSLLEEVATSLGAKSYHGDDKIVKVSIVGVGMRSHAGVASQMFGTLSKEGINILMISTSEIKISVIIDEKYLELAVRSLHSTFDLDDKSE